MSKRLENFFFAPAYPEPLGLLRALVSLALLVQALLVAPDYLELYSTDGIFQAPLQIFFSSDTVPGIVSYVVTMEKVGVPEYPALVGLGVLYIVSLIFLMLGLGTRIAAVLVWITHLLLGGTHVTAYGADQFAHFLLFYFLWMPINRAYSLDRFFGRVNGEPTSFARFSLRLVQIHLAIAYLASGLDKAIGITWWNGEAIWRSLMMPIYSQVDMSWVAQVPWLAAIFSVGTLVVEIGYPFFIFPQRTRRLWVVLTISMHLGIVAFLGLHTFGLLMASLTLSLFGLRSDPHVPVRV